MKKLGFYGKRVKTDEQEIIYDFTARELYWETPSGVSLTKLNREQAAVMYDYFKHDDQPFRWFYISIERLKKAYGNIDYNNSSFGSLETV